MCNTLIDIVRRAKRVLVINGSRREGMIFYETTHHLAESLVMVAMVTEGRQEVSTRRGLQQAPVCHPVIIYKKQQCKITLIL